MEVGNYLKRSHRDFLLIVYLCWLLAEDLIWEQKTYFCLPLDAALLVVGFQRFEEMFAGVKIAILSSPYRYQIQIIQLVCGCLLKVHLFVCYAATQSLLLFAASRFDELNNWTLTIANFSHSGWGTQYIYALYFCCTTMFTVGYGDITPKNLGEVVTIMLIQVIGIINLGYVIN
jgi:hypothetical protein